MHNENKLMARLDVDAVQYCSFGVVAENLMRRGCPAPVIGPSTSASMFSIATEILGFLTRFDVRHFGCVEFETLQDINLKY